MFRHLHEVLGILASIYLDLQDLKDQVGFGGGASPFLEAQKNISWILVYKP